MNYEQMFHTFELPKTPASTIDGHGYDSNDDDVEITDVYGSFKANNIKTANPTTIQPMQLQGMGIATPPQSPPYQVGMPPQAVHESMPLLRQFLSNSNFEAPQGYVICVPCYLCKQPFNNIDKLKAHLDIHLDIIKQTVLASRESPQHYEVDDTNILYSCDYCGKVMNSKYKLGYHRRNHHREAEAQKKAQQQAKETSQPPEGLSCHLCKKHYKRKTYLQLHMKMKHGAIKTRCQKSPLPSSSDPSPSINSTESITSTELGKRQVWSTNLLNSLAAAQYNPANEPCQKYMISEPEPRQQNFATLEPEQKYPLRSPFFNPYVLNSKRFSAYQSNNKKRTLKKIQKI